MRLDENISTSKVPTTFIPVKSFRICCVQRDKVGFNVHIVKLSMQVISRASERTALRKVGGQVPSPARARARAAAAAARRRRGDSRVGTPGSAVDRGCRGGGRGTVQYSTSRSRRLPQAERVAIRKYLQPRPRAGFPRNRQARRPASVALPGGVNSRGIMSYRASHTLHVEV
jgi:hypothetical protein